MSLSAMVSGVRAERATALADAPAALERNRLAAGRQWKERKRRAWEKARPVFEAAFKRQFSPHRFYYDEGIQNHCPYVIVSINYEGKLWAQVKAFNNEGGARYLYIHSIDAPEDRATRLDADKAARAQLYNKVAALVEEWELA